MSTRKLILLALACGLAILVAGSIQLLRIKDSETVTLAEGDSTELSTLRASVLDSVGGGGEVTVLVRLELAARAAAPIEDAADGWTLLSGGMTAPVPAVASQTGASPGCGGAKVGPGTSLECWLAFPVVPEDPGVTVVTLRFVGAQATWTLSI